MKKSFITPSIRIREVAKCNIIATSPSCVGFSGKDNGQGEASARGSWGWNDDED